MGSDIGHVLLFRITRMCSKQMWNLTTIKRKGCCLMDVFVESSVANCVVSDAGGDVAQIGRSVEGRHPPAACISHFPTR